MKPSDLIEVKALLDLYEHLSWKKPAPCVGLHIPHFMWKEAQAMLLPLIRGHLADLGVVMEKPSEEKE